MVDRESRDWAKHLERSPAKAKKAEQDQQDQRRRHQQQQRQVRRRRQGNNNVLASLNALAIAQREEEDDALELKKENDEFLEEDGGQNAHFSHWGTKHAVFRRISLLNGEVNRMSLSTLKLECQRLGLESRGKREAVKRRLKEFIKNRELENVGIAKPISSKSIDYFVVIDFEATCEERNPVGYPHEIIEFPAVLVGSRPFPPRIVGTFHSFVRPVLNPVLSEFCRTLTGIEQSVVDAADTFDHVHARFVRWMSDEHHLGEDFTFVVVTDGPFDMGRFLYLQTRHTGAAYPEYAKCWVNLRKVFANYYRKDHYASSSGGSTPNRLPGLQDMLECLGMEFEGRAHSGADDARNIAKVLMRLLADGAVVRPNERIDLKAEHSSPETSYTAKLRSVAKMNKMEADNWFKAQLRKKIAREGDTVMLKESL